MKKTRFTAFAATVLSLLLFAACTPIDINESTKAEGELSDNAQQINAGVIDFKYTERDLDGSYNEVGATSIALNGDTADISGSGASASGGVITVTDEGVYILSGTLNDGQIIVEAEDTDKVQLVFKGVYLYSSVSAPVYVKSADKVFITLADGTENTVEDKNSYTLDENEEPSGAIFSKSDLTVNGSGSLIVNANFNNGIHSKDDLTITGGIITVTSANDGLKGRDRVAICGGEISVYSAGDGICSNNDEDAALGFVSIDGGTVNVRSDFDSLQAESVLQVTGGSLTAVSGGGASGAEKESIENDFGGFNQQYETVEAEEESRKGLKAVSGLYIIGGSVLVDAYDDALHSNGDISVFEGELTLSSGDDGIHADGAVTIDGGRITIADSYEGIEGVSISVNGGEITLTASDDGFNASNGSGGEFFFGQKDAGELGGAEDCSISINGGKIYINASGDGLDSNGLLSIAGGTVYVDGPANNGNGALDYVTSSISGGTLIAAGSAGMALNMTSGGQGSILFVFSEARAAGTEISLADASGRSLVSYAPAKEFRSIVISTPEMKKGEIYSVVCGGETLASVELTEATVSVSEGGEAVGGFNDIMGGFGGGHQEGGFTPPQNGESFGGTPPDGFGEKPSRGGNAA